MDTNIVVEKINELLSQLPKNTQISIIDEEGNDTELCLDGFSCDTINDASEINVWCHQV